MQSYRHRFGADMPGNMRKKGLKNDTILWCPPWTYNFCLYLLLNGEGHKDIPSRRHTRLAFPVLFSAMKPNPQAIRSSEETKPSLWESNCPRSPVQKKRNKKDKLLFEMIFITILSLGNKSIWQDKVYKMKDWSSPTCSVRNPSRSHMAAYWQTEGKRW